MLTAKGSGPNAAPAMPKTNDAPLIAARRSRPILGVTGGVDSLQ
jgi:hypothetical protein